MGICAIWLWMMTTVSMISFIAPLQMVFVDSFKGMDTMQCGSEVSPCQSISTGVQHVEDNGTIIIYGKHTLTQSINLTKNIQLIAGKNQTPMLQNSDAGDIRFAFEISVVTLHVKFVGITFENIGIIEILSQSMVYINNCKAKGSSSEDRNMIFMSAAVTILLHISNSLFLHTSQVIYMKNTFPSNSKCMILIAQSIFINTGNIEINNAKSVVIKQSTFNTSNSSPKGSSCLDLLQIQTISITDSVFANHSSHQGGAVRIESKGTAVLLICRCQFVRNRGEIRGGAIFVKNVRTIDIRSCFFLNNTAGGSGGALSLHSQETIKITQSMFANSQAGGDEGGSIHILRRNECCGTTTIINSCNFINSSSANGGAFSQEWGNLTDIRNCNFKNCHSTVHGGAIYSNCHWMNIVRCNFTDNRSYLGGSIYHSSSSATVSGDGDQIATIYGSVFVRCRSYDRGGAIFTYNIPNVRTSFSRFVYSVSNKEGGSIFTSWTTKGMFNKCIFIENKSWGKGGAIYIETVTPIWLNDMKTYEPIIHISNNYFKNNSAAYGGAVFINDTATGTLIAAFQQKIVLLNCTFLNGSARKYAGAVGVMLKGTLSVKIEQCYFLFNKAFDVGAIYIKEMKFPDARSTGEGEDILITHSLFLDNEGISKAHAIYCNGDSHVNNVTVRKEENTNIDNIYLMGQKIIFRNIKIEISNHGTVQSNMEYTGITVLSSDIKKSRNLKLICPASFHINVNSLIGKRNALFVAKCNSCPPRTYDISHNSIHIISLSKTWKRVTECTPCPTSTICEGQIRSMNNNFGFKISPATLNSMRCPAGYCCSSHSTTCLSYNTCSKGRTGFLCGSCASDYMLSFVTNECIPKGSSECSLIIFTVYFAFGALLYTTIFTFMFEIIEIIKKVIAKRSMEQCGTSKDCTCSSGHDNLNLEIMPPSPQVSNRIMTAGRRYGHDYSTGKEAEVMRQSIEVELPLSAFITILILFYQLASLVHVETTLPRDDASKLADSGTINDTTERLTRIRKLLFDISNLRLSLSQTICPFDNLTLPLKQLLIILFKLCTILNLMMFYIFVFLVNCSPCGKHEQEGKRKCGNFETEDNNQIGVTVLKSHIPQHTNLDRTCETFGNERDSEASPRDAGLSFTGLLQIGFIKLAKLNYTSLCTILFQMIHCVKIGKESRLYVYGDQMCTTWWQYGIGYVVMPMLVIFPWSFGKGLDLLKKGQIRISCFISASLFPPQMIWYLLRKLLSYLPRQNQSSEERICIKTILSNEETLFKHSSNQLRWSVIQLYRNLLIVVLDIFLINHLYRSLTFTLVFLFFATHDWYRAPYKHPFLNIVQTMSSCFLLLITACNIPSSVSTMGDIMAVPYMLDTIDVLQWLDLILYVILPSSLIIWKLWEKYQQRLLAKYDA